MKDVSVQVVNMLLSGINQVVLRQFLGGQHERHERADIVHIFLRQLDAAQSILLGIGLIFQPLTLGIVSNAGHLMKLTVGILTVERLYQHILLIGVLEAGISGTRLGGGKLLNHLRRRHGLGLRKIEQTVPFLTVGLRSPEQRKREKENQRERD